MGKVEEYRKRRDARLKSRLDAEDDDGRWVTTQNGHKVHFNEEGVPDKGNPHVIDKMTGKADPSGESSGRKGKKRTIKDFVDLIGKFPDTYDGTTEFWRAVKNKLVEAPRGTKVSIPGYEAPLEKTGGGWMFMDSKHQIDDDDLADMMAEEDFGIFPNDDRGITYEEPD